MKSFLACALLFALSLTARAEDRVWALDEGRTFTWTCTTEFHYTALPITTTVDGKTVTRGSAGSWSATPTRPGTRPSPGRSSDPQWETIILRGTVIGRTPDGHARVEFFVEDTAIEVRFDSNGDHAQWDSRLARTTTIPAFKKYEAILGARFEAVVRDDGSIVEVVEGTWPQPDPASIIAPPLPVGRALTKAEAAREREYSAAAAAHDPTAPEAWVSMIFGTTPGKGSKYSRDVRLPDYERLDASFGGQEPIGRVSCVRTKFKSAKSQPADPRPAPAVPQEQSAAWQRVGMTLEQVSMDMLQNSDKKGHSWFSREHGILVKAEMDARGSTSMGGSVVTASFLMEVNLKSVGKTGPVATCEPPKDMPVTDFTPTVPGTEAR